MTKYDLYKEEISRLKAENANQQADLKSTIADLKIVIQTLKFTIESLQATINSKNNAIAEKDADKTKLQNQVRGISKLIDGKSEQTKVPDLQKPNAPTPKQRGNNKAKRCDHPEAEQEIIELEPEDPQYVSLLAKYIGVTEVIRYCYVPGKIIKRIYREKAYKQGERIFTGHAPAAFRPGSCYDASVVAGICQLRYEFSMPVERILKLFDEHGFEMAKATAHNLLKLADQTLDRLYSVLKDTVLKNKYQNWDETFHRTLTNENERGSRKAYLWEVIGRDDNLMFFHYDKGSREKEIPKLLLKDAAITLQSDAYAGYKELSPNITNLACLAHIKRYFKDIQEDKDAKCIISLIDKLYQKEHKHKIGEKGWSADKNLKYRKEYSKPILKEIKKELFRIKTSDGYLPKSLIAVAVEHMLSQWVPIENIFTMGHSDLDNNIAERYNRYISLSRKNSLFFGSHAGAQRAAMYYSLVCSCVMRGIRVFDYLPDVINKVNSLPEEALDNQYRELLPDRWKKP